jgi:hypothetical protein
MSFEMTPTREQIEIAAMWLESNEGDERGACVAVAEWIKQQAYATMLRDKARRAGISVVELRRLLRLKVNVRPLWPPGAEIAAQALAAIK